MPEITAKDVAALRKVTGAGMMDCKRALTESEGDMEREGPVADDEDRGGGIEFLDDFDVDAMEDAEGG